MEKDIKNYVPDSVLRIKQGFFKIMTKVGLYEYVNGSNDI